MSLQIRDLQCSACHRIQWNVPCEYQKYPRCPECGGGLLVCWAGGQPPATDVYGCAQYSDASGQWHTSQRDKIRHMKEWGYEEAGDKVGGARKDHTRKHTAISAPGILGRTSTGERRA